MVAARAESRTKRNQSAVYVRTPLELIRVLDDYASISTAVLADAFDEPAVADFLRESYPGLRLLTVR